MRVIPHLLRRTKKVFRCTPEQTLICPVCGSSVPEFLPLPRFYFDQMLKFGAPCKLSDLETLNYCAYRCPECSATDRDRLCALYLKNRLAPGNSAAAERSPHSLPIYFLDIAPSPSLARLIKTFPSVAYRSADLHRQDVDDQIDLTDMRRYRSGSFHAFICSHVLEHVPDDRKAISELYRILAPGGWGITLVPINLKADEIDEDPTLADPAERWRRFLQNDHVRLYSKGGFISRLANAGFQVRQLGSASAEFPHDSFARHGITPNSVLYVVEK